MVGENDRKMLLDAREWPVFFEDGFRYCCLQRVVDGKKEFAFLLEPGPSFEVWLGNVWDGGNGESITYEGVDALLEDGWYID